jgi:hypothetical protein
MVPVSNGADRSLAASPESPTTITGLPTNMRAADSVTA